jgi:hypothetical protein
VPFGAGAKTQVSATGGWNTMFSRDHELFFVSMGNRLMAEHTSTQANFRVDSIEPLFQLDLPNFVGISFDVSPDAKHFIVQTADHIKSTSITLLTNWPLMCTFAESCRQCHIGSKPEIPAQATK